MEITWKVSKQAFGNQVHNVYISDRWKVGAVFYSPAVARGDTKKHKAVCLLPGIKDSLGNFENTEDVKVRLEGAIRYWLMEVGIETN